MLHSINDHLINVPADMIVHTGDTGPGAYDFIAYRDCEITTFECDEEPAIYVGPFAVMFEDGDIVECETLTIARELIDETVTA